MDKVERIEKNLNMVHCSKCGKYSKKSYIEQYGTCLCGNVLNKKAKFRYEMFKDLRLWRKKEKRGYEDVLRTR